MAANLIVIPDIHQDWDWAYGILAHYDDKSEYVFLGDYFDYKRVQTYSHHQSIDKLLLLQDELVGRATWLLGNHDMHYHPINKAWYGALTASGYNKIAAEDISSKIQWDCFLLAHAEGGFLFTHAGLAPFAHLPVQASAEELAKLINQDWQQTQETLAWEPTYLHAIGRGSSRSGTVGGPFWHWPEKSTLYPVSQICGHSVHSEPWAQIDKQYPDLAFWYLDTMQNHWAELDIQTGKVTFRSV